MASGIDPYAIQLAGWLKTDAAKSRKQRRSLKAEAACATESLIRSLIGILKTADELKIALELTGNCVCAGWGIA